MNNVAPAEPTSKSSEDFEEFLTRFRNLSTDESLCYWTDLAFLLALPRPPTTEVRFKGGMLLWSLWALKKLVTCGTNRSEMNTVPENIRAAFYILPTPAHQDSLSPIISAFPEADVTLYGQPLDKDPNGCAIPCGIPENAACLPPGKRWGAFLATISAIIHLRRILRKEAWLIKDARPDLFPRLAELIFRTEVFYARLSENRRIHREIFLSYELTPECKALARWAREGGARVIHVMHGQRLPTYQITVASDLILFSKVDESWFRDRIGPDVEIHCKGHPRLETIREMVGLPESHPNEELPRITFFSQPAEVDYTRELRIRDWKILRGLEGRAKVKLRLHPRESRAQASEDLVSAGVRHVEISESGLVEDLAWCDGIASSWSTVSMEAAVCGRAVFWTCASPERYPASADLRKHGIGALVSSQCAWEPWLQQWNSGKWSSPAIISDSSLRELGMIGAPSESWPERLNLDSAT